MDRRTYYANDLRVNTPRILDEYHEASQLPAASAAAALAQLHTQKAEDWQSEIVSAKIKTILLQQIQILITGLGMAV